MSLRSRCVAAFCLTASAILLPIPSGCQGTCETTSECGADEFCSIVSEACLTSKSLGFCKAKPTACSGVSSPVCGCDGQTYDNMCEAAKHGTSVAGEGICGGVCGGVTGTECVAPQYCQAAVGACSDATATGTCKTPPTECPQTSSPVCGCDGKTYASACSAALASTALREDHACSCSGPDDSSCGDGWFCQYATGACAGASPSAACAAIPASCSNERNPVCSCDGRTYDNACKASLAKASIATEGACACADGAACEPGRYCQYAVGACVQQNPTGACATIPTTCPDASSPVCGCDGKTYDNACKASLAGTSILMDGACPCGGTDAVACPAGTFCEYLEGACLGANPKGTCAAVPVVCSPAKSPACGCDGKTYDNACEAAKQAVSIAVPEACAVPDAGADADAG